MSDIISRLDYANQLKPSDVSVTKFDKNILKIDYVNKSKTNLTIPSEQLQSSLVQDTLSASVLLPPKLVSEALNTCVNYSPGDRSLQEDLPPLMSIRSKPINNGTPVSSPDVTVVTLESKDYMLSINSEAVLDESLYSDATSEGIHNDNFSEAKTHDAG